MLCRELPLRLIFTLGLGVIWEMLFKKKNYYDTVYILEENANFLKKRLGTLEGIIKVATKRKSVSNPINCLCQTCELSVNLFQYFIFSYTETGNTD